MSPVNGSNAPATGTTSRASQYQSKSAPAIEQPLKDQVAAQHDTKALSESAYLAKQAADAQAAISATLTRLKAQVAETVDPREWTKQYPYVAVGAAAVAGFAATMALVPSAEERALRRLKRIEEALNPSPPPPPKAAEETGEQRFAKGKSSFMSSVLLELISAIKPAIISLLTAGVTAQAAQPDQPAPQQPAQPQPQPADSGVVA